MVKVCLNAFRKKELYLKKSMKWKRKRSRDAQRKYRGTVSDMELDRMRLSAHMCKRINKRTREGAREILGDPPMSNVNDSMFIKSDRIKYYHPDLEYCNTLSVEPSDMCPDESEHLKNVSMSPLCLACSTCWSLQRNGFLSGSPQWQKQLNHDDGHLHDCM